MNRDELAAVAAAAWSPRPWLFPPLAVAGQAAVGVFDAERGQPWMVSLSALSALAVLAVWCWIGGRGRMLGRERPVSAANMASSSPQSDAGRSSRPGEGKRMHFEFTPNGRVMAAPDWSDAVYEKLAVALSNATGLQVEALDEGDPTSAGYRGFRLSESGTHYVDVYRMTAGWRVAAVPKDRLMPVPDRFWCFPGPGLYGLCAAVQAVVEWHRQGTGEPSGWTRSWDREDQ